VSGRESRTAGWAETFCLTLIFFHLFEPNSTLNCTSSMSGDHPKLKNCVYSMVVSKSEYMHVVIPILPNCVEQHCTGSGRLAKYIGRMHVRPASILCELECAC